MRAFVDAVSTGAEWTLLCERIASLLGTSGAAVLRWDPLGDVGRPLGAHGSWEGEALERLLALGRCEWAFALTDGPAFARQSEGKIRAARDPMTRASAVSVPLHVGPERVGALVCTYSEPRAIAREDVAGSELIALCVALVCFQQDLTATSDRQAKRIARLMDDIERMAINLRGGAPRGEMGTS